MADADLTAQVYSDRAIALTDYLIGLNLSAAGADTASSLDTLAELIRKVFANPPSDLTDAEQDALKSALDIVEGGAGLTPAQLLRLLPAPGPLADGKIAKIAGGVWVSADDEEGPPSTIPDSVANQLSGGAAVKLWTGTKAQFDAIATKDAATVYIYPAP